MKGEHIPDSHVDKSAFSHARKKVKLEIYDELNRYFLDSVYENTLKKRYGIYRVFAIDGTLLDLPSGKEIKDEFGVWEARNGNSNPRARASVLYDCLNHVSIDFSLRPKKFGERIMAGEHIIKSSFWKGDIVTLDRGYASAWLFLLILSKAGELCCRMPTSWNEVKDFMDKPDEKERIIKIRITGFKNIMMCKKFNLEQREFNIRLVKIKLDSGETEILATSLLSDEYDNLFFKELYVLRWQIEENYKVMKCRIKIEKFVGKSPLALKQEFNARMFMLNVASVLRNIAQGELKEKKKVQRKHEVKINFKAVLSKMKRYGVNMFFERGFESILKLIRLFKESLTPIRTNRKNPRNKKNVTGYFQTYPSI